MRWWATGRYRLLVERRFSSCRSTELGWQGGVMVGLRPLPGKLPVVNFGVGETFLDEFLDPGFFLGSEEPTVDSALDSIQEFEPILERRFLNGLPLVVPFFSGKKPPLTPH